MAAVTLMAQSEFPLLRWVWSVALAEVVGFALPGLAWGGAWALGLPAVATALVVITAGAGEGAVLGFGQWRVLRETAPVGPIWVRATSLGATIAWTWGMAPSTIVDMGAPVYLAVAVGVVAVPMLLMAMPVMQWWTMWGQVERAWRWIPWSAAAWLVALPPTFLAPALLPGDAPVPLIAITWLAAGAMMAVLVALGTGLAMRRLLESTAPMVLGAAHTAKGLSRAPRDDAKAHSIAQ